MGLFKKAKESLGHPDNELLEHGRLARGNVKDVRFTGSTVGDPNSEHGLRALCDVTVEVIGLDGEEPYDATCRTAIPRVYLPQLEQPGAAVAVRVDPTDDHHVALDLATDVPPAPVILVSDDGSKQTLQAHKSTYTAAEILAQGSPCTADVLAVIPLNQTDSTGRPATGLVLTVHRDGAEPYQAQIGVHVPEAATATVTVGATIPVRWVPGPGLPTDVNLVTPDWPALLDR